MPRMWMTAPALMCRKHLVAEHHECHVFAGRVQKGLALTGYLANNLLEPGSLRARHDELVAEMGRRGYKHSSPFPEIAVEDDTRIDRGAARAELLARCPECNRLHKEAGQ